MLSNFHHLEHLNVCPVLKGFLVIFEQLDMVENHLLRNYVVIFLMLVEEGSASVLKMLNFVSEKIVI